MHTESLNYSSFQMLFPFRFIWMHLWAAMATFAIQKTRSKPSVRLFKIAYYSEGNPLLWSCGMSLAYWCPALYIYINICTHKHTACCHNVAITLPQNWLHNDNTCHHCNVWQIPVVFLWLYPPRFLPPYIEINICNLLSHNIMFDTENMFKNS